MIGDTNIRPNEPSLPSVNASSVGGATSSTRATATEVNEITSTRVANPSNRSMPSNAQATTQSGNTSLTGNKSLSGNYESHIAKESLIAKENESVKESDGEKARVQLKQAVKRLEDFTQSMHHDLTFRVDEKSGKTIVSVIDSKTKEVIREIPGEDAIRLSEEIEQMRSLFFAAQA